MAYKRKSPQPVVEGGTGAQTLTMNGVLIGAGTSAITPLTPANDGELIIGSSGNSPIVTSLTSGSGISITPGPGSISIAATGGSNGPAFLAYQTSDSSSVTGAGTVWQIGSDGTWSGGIIFDTDSAFDDSTCTYTIPTTGLYQINVQVEVSNTDAAMEPTNLVLSCSMFGDVRSRTVQTTGTGGRYTNSITILAFFSVAETLTLNIAISGGISDDANVAGTSSPYVTYFSGFFVRTLPT